MKLVVVGQAVFASYALPAGKSLVIGRSESSDLRIDEPSISRKHARIAVGSAIHVEDLGSANGTRVRGERLSPGRPVEVAPGEAFHVGQVMVVAVADKLPAPALGVRADQVETRRANVVTAAPRSTRPSSGPEVHVIEDPAMRSLYAMVARVAAGNINVLVLGETGVGKELVAETLHARSRRHAGPFVCLNCASLSEQLLEAELFGYERGAFTGAVQTKVGLLEAAHEGTVFLDEVGEMPLTLQAKLLRVIESGELLRVGAVKPRAIDVRFVAATNRDLEVSIREGIFRQDLYYRLGGAKLVIPPLRERRAEIEPLARGFAARAFRQQGRPGEPGFSPEAIHLLNTYVWPGNVRELRNFVERAVLLSDGPTLSPEHFPVAEMAAALPLASIAPPSASGDGDDERARILQVLHECAGNQSRAAKVLGIARSTLVTRLDAYGVPRPRKS
jgi:two-component system response regulator AtoC